MGDHPLAAVATIVGRDDHTVGQCGDLVLEDQQFLGSGAEDRDHLVAGLLERLYLWPDHRVADAAADADNRLAAGRDFRRLAERTGEVENLVADRQAIQVAGGLADFLGDEGNRPAFGIAVGNGQRDAFAVLAHAEDHELAGLTALGDMCDLDLEEHGLGGQFAGRDDLVTHGLLLRRDGNRKAKVALCENSRGPGCRIPRTAKLCGADAKSRTLPDDNSPVSQGLRVISVRA